MVKGHPLILNSMTRSGMYGHFGVTDQESSPLSSLKRCIMQSGYGRGDITMQSGF